jgi:hypothetical protein
MTKLYVNDEITLFDGTYHKKTEASHTKLQHNKTITGTYDGHGWDKNSLAGHVTGTSGPVLSSRDTKNSWSHKVTKVQR